MLLQTRERYVSALGGSLELVVRLPGQAIGIHLDVRASIPSN